MKNRFYDKWRFYKVTVVFFTTILMRGFMPLYSESMEMQKKTSVELTFSLGWNIGCYKETTFANISQSLMCPRFQLETKIFSKDFLHIVTADYFFDTPSSAMTKTSVVYKNFDPVSGENYYEASECRLAFHRIRLKYDLVYRPWKTDRLDLYVGGNFS